MYASWSPVATMCSKCMNCSGWASRPPAALSLPVLPVICSTCQLCNSDQRHMMSSGSTSAPVCFDSNGGPVCDIQNLSGCGSIAIPLHLRFCTTSLDQSGSPSPAPRPSVPNQPTPPPTLMPGELEVKIFCKCTEMHTLWKQHPAGRTQQNGSKMASGAGVKQGYFYPGFKGSLDS
jgi:hypothetical protein